jgi:hypothetical protein
MTFIDRRLVDPHFPAEPAHSLFVAARHAMNLAFISWLNACPAANDVDLEADASRAVIRGLVALSRGGTP